MNLNAFQCSLLVLSIHQLSAQGEISQVETHLAKGTLYSIMHYSGNIQNIWCASSILLQTVLCWTIKGCIMLVNTSKLNNTKTGIVYINLLTRFDCIYRVRLRSCCNATGVLYFTKQNTAVNDSIPYETNSKRSYKVNTEVHDMLPEVWGVCLCAFVCLLCAFVCLFLRMNIVLLFF